MGCPCSFEAATLNLRHRMLNLRFAEDRLSKRLDVRDVTPSTRYIRRHGGLERAIASEDDDRVNGRRRHIKHRFQRLHMLVVLTERILKSERLPKYCLSPLGLTFTPEDPTSHVLSFHNEYAKSTHDDMVNLRGAVRCRKRYIVKRVVGLCGKPKPRGETNKRLSAHPFEPR